MIVNSVNIKFIKPHNGLIGFANVVVDNNLYLSSIAIFERMDRTYRLQYPTKRGESEKQLLHLRFAPDWQAGEPKFWESIWIRRETSDFVWDWKVETGLRF